ncbi:MAG: FkbM family methyltransferase [Desulfamplus sp.]
MKNLLSLILKPYTAITLNSLNEGESLLENILLDIYELQPRRIDKPIILYGAGELGKMAKEFLANLNIPFLYVVDKNADKYKNDANWQDVSIIGLDQVNAEDKKNTLLIICIVTIPLIALKNQLIAAGWEDITFFYDVSEAYCDCQPISNGWFIKKISLTEKELIKKVYSSFNDDVSRMYYIQFLAWRRLRMEVLFSDIEINMSNRFFIPELVSVLNEQEVFVDCGAHKGFVIKKFLETVQNKYNHIYAIEPDKQNFQLCKTALENIENITMIECALSNDIGKMAFYEGFDYASKLSSAGNTNIMTITLDSLNIPATFIKIHLEGGELNALKGALNTINKSRPIIAVTTYHNSDGAFRIPCFFIENMKDYLFYMRLHSWGGTGAVFYSIPLERL